jgi:hypothetical protein
MPAALPFNFPIYNVFLVAFTCTLIEMVIIVLVECYKVEIRSRLNGPAMLESSYQMLRHLNFMPTARVN